MYITAATLAAIWCAAEFTAPSRAMNSAMKVKAVTSTRNVPPMGTPSASSRRWSRSRGHDQRANTPWRR